MLTIIALLSLFLTSSNINAKSLPTFTFLPEHDIVPRLDDFSLAASCAPCQCPTNDANRREIINIVWSCLLTIFACTWTAIHPNIPAQEDGSWIVIGRKLQSMIFMLLAPEIVVCWAIRQWSGARAIADRFQAYGWTKTHGFFIQMGGFMLYDGDQQLGILSADRLQTLADSGAIEFPKITKKEIMDRSKGDYLAKAIIILQTSWFIVQCIARAARHLALTEIELVTMAFPFLNWVMYFFWWDKPVDIQCSVPVFLKSSQEKGLQADEIISQPNDSNSPLDNTGRIRPFYSDKAQAFSRHSNPKSSTSSLVSTTYMSCRTSLSDDVHVHTTPVNSHEDEKSLLDATQESESSRTRSLPLANICGVQVTPTPTIPRRQSLHHNVDAVPQIFTANQGFEPNPKTSSNSILPENIRDVEATAPSVYDDIDIRTTAPVLFTEAREDDKPELPPANVRCIQTTVPTMSCPSPRSLCDDGDIHIISVIPSNQNLTHILPRDPSDLSRQVSQVSAESTYSELQNTWIWKTITFLHLTPFAAMAGVPMSGSASIPNHSKRIHTFYAQALNLGESTDGSIEQQPVLTACTGATGMAFAAIHCIAWHFSFPTHLEQTIWRVSALLVVLAPNLFVLLPLFGLTEYVLSQSLESRYGLNILRGVMMFSVLGTLFLYFPARVYLLVEACISLRSLQASALEDVKWTSFIPHLA